jgi:hypothetical protein
MATTVLTGTSGALYYKPAGTTASFAPADVTTVGALLNVGSYFNFKVGDPVKFRVVNQQGGTPAGTLPAGLTAGTTYFVIGYAPTTGVLTVSATLGGSADHDHHPRHRCQPQQVRGLLTRITPWLAKSATGL